MAESQFTRVLYKVTFSMPSGLLVVDHVDSCGKNQHVCLLQHNVVNLRPAYCKVKELKYAVSPKECAKIIEVAEDYATRNGGWTNRRHTHYATTDIPVDMLFGEDSWVDERVNSSILPEIATFFKLDLNRLHIGELFVVKYDAQNQSSLSAHVDGTPWSFVVALNDASNFTGGGTHFLNTKITCRPSKAGTAVLFSGKNLHEGVTVTTGVRYILTGFCEYTHDDSSGDHIHPNLEASHEAFMKEYDPLCDGFAAKGGVRTGDVIKGVYCDSEEVVQRIDETNTLQGCMEKWANNTKSSKKCSLLIERRRVVVDMSSKTAEGTSSDNVSAVAAAVGDDCDSDNRMIMDLIQQSDVFLTVGQYWKFDDMLK